MLIISSLSSKEIYRLTADCEAGRILEGAFSFSSTLQKSYLSGKDFVLEGIDLQTSTKLLKARALEQLPKASNDKNGKYHEIAGQGVYLKVRFGSADDWTIRAIGDILHTFEKTAESEGCLYFIDYASKVFEDGGGILPFLLRDYNNLQGLSPSDLLHVFNTEMPAKLKMANRKFTPIGLEELNTMIQRLEAVDLLETRNDLVTLTEKGRAYVLK